MAPTNMAISLTHIPQLIRLARPQADEDCGPQGGGLGCREAVTDEVVRFAADARHRKWCWVRSRITCGNAAGAVNLATSVRAQTATLRDISARTAKTPARGSAYPRRQTIARKVTAQNPQIAPFLYSVPGSAILLPMSETCDRSEQTQMEEGVVCRASHTIF